MNLSTKAFYVIALGAAGSAMAQPPVMTGPPQIIVHKTNPHNQSSAPPPGSTSQITPDITYHGGPIMGRPNVYLIWYGNWNQNNGSDTAAGQQIILDLLYGLSASPYYVTNASYPGVSGSFSVVSAYSDSYSEGTNLTDSRVASVVSNAINGGHLPKDGNGIYFVLTSSDVAETSGFCSRYCGWHTYGTLQGTNIMYAFVGNAHRCLSSCAIQTNSPNGNAGVDGMASVVAHELEESNTDPNLNAWYDSSGAEDADKCAWTFGQSLSKTAGGAYYNMMLTAANGSQRPFLIQRELDVNSYCYVNYVTKAQ